jgi:hypothetical protein
MATLSHDAPEAHPIPTVVQTLLILLGVIVVCAAYLGLNAALGVNEGYVGFLFLFFWAGIQKSDLAVLPSTAVGSFVGVALGLALQQFTAKLGPPGALIFLGLVLVTLFLFLRRQLRIAINDATMLMLTVATVAHIQQHADFAGMFISLAVGVAFFGGLFWLVARLRARSLARTPAGATVA